MTVVLQNARLTVDFEAREVTSLILNGKERTAGRCPLFRLRLRDRAGDPFVFTAYDAKDVTLTEDGALYSSFSTQEPPTAQMGLRARVSLREKCGEAEWSISVTPADNGMLVEWVEFPLISLTRLRADCEEGGEILIPYNEGVLVSDWELRQRSVFPYREPEYPSQGSYFIFPNMMESQMEAYLWSDVGLYIGAHDARRGVKGIDFYQTDEGTEMQLRLFCGVGLGETYATDFPIVWSAVGGSWQSAAERYRTWFESALPPRAKKIIENVDLPEWYDDEPLVVAYPVRGIHDRDDMTPNRMYPYTNALPKLDAIRKATASRLLVLLMHWEGSAPWAPPYTMPPFGDEENFWRFRRTLREQGDLFGVYCSGFSYSIQSCMIPEYNKQKEFDERGLVRGMCAGPDGEVAISEICRMQRAGYDVCPASEVGRALMREAYEPLLRADLDYAQILDQNHGGSQYFCYSRDHGHPPAPGAWMTERMQALLAEWNETASGMLLGCESAAAEPYIGNLLFSDNRYEINYRMGVSVPFHSYVYHEYLRNFMGNQVSCPFREEVDENLWYRLAYSFSIGDCMTLVLDQDGQIKSRWGKSKLDYEYAPDQEPILRMVRNLTAFYREQAKPFLYAGRMIEGQDVECGTLTFERYDLEAGVTLPAILSSAWEAPDGRRAQILVNPQDREVSCRVGGRSISIAPLSAMLLDL